MDRRDAAPIEDTPEGRSHGLIVERVSTRPPDPRPTSIALFVAALVLLAIAKPWGFGAVAPSFIPRPATPAAPTPRPTTDTSAEGLAGPICLGAGAWRVTSLEAWRTQNVRVWRAIDPVASATGPLDPAIPSVPIVAVQLAALGWCAPAFGPDVPVGPAAVSAWQVIGGVATDLHLQQVRPDHGTTPLAALYLPVELCKTPPACLSPSLRGEPAAWTTGLVIFHWLDVGTGREAWFGADVTIAPA